MLTNRAKTLIICGYLIFRGIAQVVEQRSPKPRAEGSNPSAPAKQKSLRFTRRLFCFTEQRRTRGTRSVPGNACERRRWRIQRADLGAAVEKIEEKRQPEDFFGHRKRGCEATSSPSAPATGKALKPLGFRAFSLLFFESGARSALPHRRT